MDVRPVVIVGAGLSGLCCARRLTREGRRCLVLEASDDVGGRVRTDEVDGFRLDRGFQVLQTAYPEAQRELDLDALSLSAFEPGALVRRRGRFWKVMDPWRRPLAGVLSARAPIGSIGDKMKIGALRRRSLAGSLDELMQRPSTTTLRHLQDAGVSAEMIDAFFRPFYGGVFLERELRTSSRMFEFTFRMFATGDAALPAGGMAAIPRQLAAALPEGTIRCGVAVDRVDADGITTAAGERIEAGAVVVAVDGESAGRLLGSRLEDVATKSVTNLHFAAARPPIRERLLVLNGDGGGPINDLCVPSRIAPGYAPEGRALVSVSVLEENASGDVESAVRAQLADWFGRDVDRWRTLRVQRIRSALPELRPEDTRPVARPVRLEDGTFVCGDHRDMPSIQGAMASGHRAAEAVLATLGAV